MRVKLRERRELLGLTQEEVAIMSGIARNTYTNIELGVKDPSFKVALRIKKAMDYYGDDIFLNENVPKQDTNKETA